MPVNIHGKQYITVAERLTEAKGTLKSVFTEVLFQEPVVIKATITTEFGTFTGISAANPDKTLEKQSPYEVAETSAVGRALGFAGFGSVEGIATADEMIKADVQPDPIDDSIASTSELGNCKDCGEPNTRYKTGRIGCSKFCWKK
jgi:hypothetical protein